MKSNNDIPLNKWLVLSDGSFICLTEKTKDDLYHWYGISNDGSFCTTSITPSMFSIDEFSGEAFEEKIKELLVEEWNRRIESIPNLKKCLIKLPGGDKYWELPWNSMFNGDIGFLFKKNCLFLNGYIIFNNSVWAKLKEI